MPERLNGTVSKTVVPHKDPGFESLPLRQIFDWQLYEVGRVRKAGGHQRGEVPERSNGAVLKTADPQGSQGSNPCLSAKLS